MLAYVLKRIVYAFLVLLGVTIFVFFLSTLMPGDPVLLYLEPPFSDEAYAAMQHQMGLDLPVTERFFFFIGNLFQGDMGDSYIQKRPVSEIILERLPWTMYLAFFAMLFAITISIPLGIVAATNRGKPLNYGGMAMALLGVSIPGFWLGIILILVFALWIPILPASGRPESLTDIEYIILPALSMGIAFAASNARLTRSSMLEVLEQDYIQTARAKGCARRSVIYRHALRNALIPVITHMGIQFAILLGGALVIEIVFTYPGVGLLMYESITQRDFYLLQGCVLVLATAFVFINLIVDIMYAYLDPRIKYD